MPGQIKIVDPVVRNPLDNVLPERRIRAHASALGGAPGAEVSGLEPAGTGNRIRYQNGAIYVGTDTPACWVHGAIADHYDALGGSAGWMGLPKTDETGTPDGRGRYNHFEHGSIYWTPSTGAFEVHGAIRDKWATLGWETSFLAYPITDETGTPDGRGRYNQFEHGSIYWSPSTGAFELQAAELPASITAHGKIVFNDSTPIGGSADIALNRDGTFVYSGHLHDSGAPDYSVTTTCVVAVPSIATAYTFTHNGDVHGDLPGSRDDDWHETGSRQELTTTWIDLCAGHETTFTTDGSVDLGGLVHLVKKYYPYIAAVVALL